jgi:hypothetical protein
VDDGAEEPWAEFAAFVAMVRALWEIWAEERVEVVLTC